MPDHNKFKKLREIGYTIPVVCGLCVHREFQKNALFGGCTLHKYRHLKHDNPEGGRSLSICVYGTCKDAQIDQSRVTLLGSHAEFQGP